MMYLESRNKQTPQVEDYSRKELNPENATTGIMVSDIWTQKALINETMFTDSNKG